MKIDLDSLDFSRNPFELTELEIRQIKFYLLKLEIDEDECWCNPSARRRNSYGKIGFRNNRQGLYSHVFMRQIFTGEISTLDTLHTCDKPWCCNPSHLYLGDAKANHKDMVDRGRRKTHSSETYGKLSFDQIRSIRSDIREHSAIASEFKISISSVARIKALKRWAWVPL